MEVLRALAALCEPPGRESARLAEPLGLGEPPAASDWSELFLFQLSPYASVYLGADGRIGGEARDRIAGFWRALGLVPPNECDHLAILLAFQAELAERSLAAPDEAERRRWEHVARAFLWEHLLSWLPPFLTRLERVSPAFFRAWGALLARVLAAEAGRGERPVEPPLHWRSAPTLVDPRRDGSAAFLETLLAPAASGLWLTRADLERAGRDLGLALRLGERRFVLETLLAQGARPVLGWLAAESEDWRARLAAKRADGLEIGSFWIERAAGSARLLAALEAEAD